MEIPIHCEHCGEIIATLDTSEESSVEWAEAPCGDKICKACCEECANAHDTYHACMFKEDAGL